MISSKRRRSTNYIYVLWLFATDVGKLVTKSQTIKATGGHTCSKTSSKECKVRKNEFVGAFCQSNVGDVTPNVLGAFCTDTGRPCDFKRSSCNGNDLLCLGRGPGYVFTTYFENLNLFRLLAPQTK